jgi:hypothetical protein
MIDSMRRCCTWLLFLSILFAPAGAAAAPSQGWSPLATGIDFQLFHLSHPRPINLFVARLSRLEPSVTLDSAISGGSLIAGRETVSSMAARYDQSINFWDETWGNRNRVVAAINGYFFNLASGEPLSGQVQSGWYAKRFSDYVGDAGFAWNIDRSPSIGKCVYHNERDQFITVLRTGETKKINHLNTARLADELVLYTPQYAASTGTDTGGVEVRVEMKRPSLVLPGPAMALGKIVKIRDLQGDTPLLFDQVVLSASGVARDALLSKIVDGDEIGISQEISNCASSPQVNWSKTYAATGGDYHFLTAGELTIDTSNPDASVPNSRTAIAFNASSVYFIVIDGWNPGVSEGISILELGGFARDTLGASEAVTMDSGGSSTMVINGQVVNNTYCNFTRQCGMQSQPNHERTRVGQIDLEFSPAQGAAFLDQPGSQPSAALEPLVGNAWMMLAVEPKVQSSRLQPDQIVMTTQATELRLGPGTNYAQIAMLATGAKGVVLYEHYNDLHGVLAKGAYWQPVKFGTQTGWVRQDALFGLPDPGQNPIYMPSVRR